MICLVISPLSLPLAIMFYQSKVGNETVTKIAWSACMILLPAASLFVAIFFLNIKNEYRKTFWSTKRGKDMTLGLMDSTKDNTKAKIFLKNCRHWREIEGKVEDWVQENWNKWMEEQPDWLDENMKARIPPHMIPNVGDREEVENLHSKRRKASSLVGDIVSSTRQHSMAGLEKVVPEKEHLGK